jgi:hypothetical protein
MNMNLPGTILTTQALAAHDDIDAASITKSCGSRLY